MNIEELIERLQEIVEEYGPDIKLRIAEQEAWPIKATVWNVCVGKEGDEYTCWIADGACPYFENPYASRKAWSEEYYEEDEEE